jgi:hypothetical protein
MYDKNIEANVSNAHKVIIASLTVNDRFGGLVACQGKGKSTSSEYCKQFKKLLMLMSAFVSK